jgi:hypothetical protein
MTGLNLHVQYYRLQDPSHSIDRHNVFGELPVSELLSLSFRSERLIGTLPETIGNLTKLQTLDVGFNCLAREIPATVNRLTALQQFDVSRNNLTRSPTNSSHSHN